MTDSQPQHITLATLSAALIAALIWVIPLNNRFALIFDNPSPDTPARLLAYTYIAPIDLIFAALIVTAVVGGIKSSSRGPMGIAGVGSIGAVAVILIAVFMTPSPGGWMLLLRLAGVAATVATVRMMRSKEVMIAVVWTFVLSASLQALLALSQTFIWGSGRSGRTDLALSGDIWTAGLGTFHHEYALAAYLSLGAAIVLASRAIRPLRSSMLVSVALSSAAIATSFGRSAALSILALSAVYGVGWLIYRQRELLIFAVIPASALSLTAVLAASAWMTRASLESSIRLTLARQALEIVRDHPLSGIGPMRYGPHIANLDLPQIHQFIVHSVPLIVGAEYGIIVGLAFVGWLIALGVRAFGSSVGAAALFVIALPYLLLDHVHYVDPAGIAMLGIWLAVLDALTVWSPSDSGTLDLKSHTSRHDSLPD